MRNGPSAAERPKQSPSGHNPIIQRLTGGRLLVRNTVWNLAGQLGPAVVALFAIPPLVHHLGTQRFGILTLLWMVIGYFSLFDFGLGRALTTMLARHIGVGDEREIPKLIWTALGLMFALGVVGAVILAAFAGPLVRSVLKVAPELQGETVQVLLLLAPSVPIVIVTTGLRGVLEAQQRFGLINAVRIPMGLYSFLAPLCVLPFSNTLLPIVVVLVIGRAVVCAIHFALCFRVTSGLSWRVQLARSAVRPLISLGGWMTVSNVISPLMTYVDRFFIGAYLSMSAVAYYATPYEMITKLLLIPAGVTGVLFPAFSASLAQTPGRATRLFERSAAYSFLVLFLPILLVVTVAREGLGVWLGADFAAHSTLVLQWLAVGVFVNSFAQISFTLVHGAARPDLTAKLHMIELPVYLAVLWWLARSHGVAGAAMAWTGRIVADAIILFVLTTRFLPDGKRTMARVGRLIGLGVLAFVPAFFVTGLWAKVLYLALVLVAFVALAWSRVLADDERTLVRRAWRVG